MSTTVRGILIWLGLILAAVALFGDSLRASFRVLDGDLSPGFGPLQIGILVLGVVLFLIGAVFHKVVGNWIGDLTGEKGKRE
ncbi:MAG: hypothetical protein CMM50_13350 [Rhodospirillaceae bacterium]|nr:hypothetical protein [Rhodospirillaceae bacterium]|tara:strand:- start:5 stop:250 length:246 start_codon:yes stop_codon:yes gene_type:complete